MIKSRDEPMQKKCLGSECLTEEPYRRKTLVRFREGLGNNWCLHREAPGYFTMAPLRADKRLRHSTEIPLVLSPLFTLTNHCMKCYYFIIPTFHHSCLEYAEWGSGDSLLSTICRISDTLNYLTLYFRLFTVSPQNPPHQYLYLVSEQVLISVERNLRNS